MRNLPKKQLHRNVQTPGSIGLDLFTTEDNCVPAEGQILIPTDLILASSLGLYLRIASKSGLALNQGLVVEGGVIDPDYWVNVSVLLKNNTKVDRHLEVKKSVAQVIMEKVH